MVKVPLRKSFNKEKISAPISQAAVQNKQPASILPPKKVIKALHDYDAQAAHELGFSKGDFFHVVSNENDPNWYEAYNPVTNARGLVPVSYFQVLGKTEKTTSTGSAPDGAPLSPPQPSPDPAASNKPQPLYGIVQFDFIAERPDELDAKAGEAIIVIAQSNHEWFVAKPIGRLGGPGLIPVSFIEIRDPTTGRTIENVQELMSKALVPKVEEWKKQTADYKNNSIPLGRFDFADATRDAPPEPVLEANANANANTNGGSHTAPQPGLLVAASVESFHFEDEHYWFLIRVELSSGLHRVLYRLYDDLYEFQIALLDTFPAEAGRTGEERILPFMPGPLSYVNDTITAQRRADLDTYVKELCALPEYILQSPLVNDFLLLREGDVETPYDPRMAPRQSNSTTATGLAASNDRYSGRAPSSKHSQHSLDSAPVPTPEQQLPDMGRLSLAQNNNDPQYQDNYQVGAGAEYAPHPGTYPKRYDNLVQNEPNSHLYDILPTPASPATSQNQFDAAYGAASSRVPATTSKSNNNSRSASPLPPVAPSSTNASNLIKIKIFHQEDLIAIRVSADVSLIQLVDKCRDRLGDSWSVLKYRDDRNSAFKDIVEQTDLNWALWGNPNGSSGLSAAQANKLVLYAE